MTMGSDKRAGTLPITAAAAARAADWLMTAWSRHADHAEFSIDALALAHLCSLLNPGSAQFLDDLTGTLTDGSPLQWGAGNLLPSLLAASAALRQANGSAQGAVEYLSLLDELLPEAEGANGALLWLALRGAADITPTATATLEQAAEPRMLRSGQRQDVGRLLSAIEAATMFGLVNCNFKPALAALLEGAAMAALRAYDLPLAMRLLRARVYVQPGRSLGLTTGIEFLWLSQCEDGGFGDFDTAVARLAMRGDQHGELRLKLPVTLQALWTMAEVEDPSFRLVRAAFSGPASPPLRRGSWNADTTSGRVVQA